MNFFISANCQSSCLSLIWALLETSKMLFHFENKPFQIQGSHKERGFEFWFNILHGAKLYMKTTPPWTLNCMLKTTSSQSL